MLAELRISNFALIDSLHLDFPPGFLVFTGETGTGKSLLIDALLLLIGGRASSDQIRFGAEEALLEGRFVIPPTHSLLPYLQENGYLLKDQDELLVRRILCRTGKNRIYLNGQMAPLQVLQEIGQELVDIHGQHDQQSLLAPKTQLKLLDAFGNLDDQVSRYQRLFKEWNQAKTALEDFQRKFLDGGNRLDMLQYQLNELKNMQLQPGEEEQLHEEYHRLKHSGRLGELSGQAFRALYEEDQSILGQLKEVGKALQELGEIDPRSQPWCTLVDSAEAALREVTDNLRDYREQMEFDPERMEAIDGRLAIIQRGKKKYGKSVDELLRMTKDLEQEMDILQHCEEETARLQTAVAERHQAMKDSARDLSVQRKKAAGELVRQVNQEFGALKMGPMTIQVEVEDTFNEQGFGPNGGDEIEVLIAPNPGEPPQPLGRIASGGELSRIMLALKTVFAGNDRTPVLIFDEIDSGVGGEAGLIMGTRLRGLGKFHQVCCITHLPQIAAQAHTQYVVEKISGGGRTLTRVQRVTGEDREMEIARMFGGGTLTPTIRQTAAELLQQAQRTEGNGAVVPSNPGKYKKRTGKG